MVTLTLSLLLEAQKLLSISSLHPNVIIGGYFIAMEKANSIIDSTLVEDLAITEGTNTPSFIHSNAYFEIFSTALEAILILKYFQ